MTMRLSPRALPPKLFCLAIIALGVCASCSGQPMPGAGKPRMPSARPPAPRFPGGRPDPRYRQPLNFAELQAVAGEVAKSTGREIKWHLARGANPGPLVSISGGLENCTIFIHPVAARQVPPNTWAFLFGHEFAHLVENLGDASETTPAKELKADIAGARYAMAAGYRLETFLGWVLTEPNQSSDSHGSLRKRVHAIAAHFGLPQAAVQAQAQRYSTRRAPVD